MVCSIFGCGSAGVTELQAGSLLFQSLSKGESTVANALRDPEQSGEAAAGLISLWRHGCPARSSVWEWGWVVVLGIFT